MPALTEALVIIGMLGVGKTTVGRVLAARLGWDFVDTDDLVTEHLGEDVPAYINRAGIDAFRVAEQDAVARLGGRGANTVIAVGGGSVIAPANRAELAALGPVVWLRATPATLLDHFRGDPTERPLLAGDAAEAIDRLLDERSELYAALATHVVDVDDRTPDDVANEVLLALRALP